VTAELQETIESIRIKLEEVSEEKLLVENKFKQLEEANSEAEKYNQELSHATEKLSEEKFRHEAEILALNQAIENLKSKLESIAKEKSLLKSWFADLEQVVERGRRIFPE
jgi:predicted nuclease with TOPRIM domain